MYPVIKRHLNVQVADRGHYVTELCHDGAAAVAASTTANDVTVIDMCTGQVLQKHSIETPIVGLGFANRVLHFMDKDLNVHQMDPRTEDRPTCRKIVLPKGQYDLTSSAFNENFIAFATSGPTGEDGEDAPKDDSSDEEDDDSHHIVWMYDMTDLTNALAVSDAHSNTITTMAFRDDLLLTGGSDGLFNVIDVHAQPQGIADQVIATLSMESPVDKVGMLELPDRDRSHLYATTDDLKWNLLKMNAPDDIDKLYSRRIVKERFLVDIVSIPRYDYPLASVECTPEGKVLVVGTSLDGTKSAIISECQSHVGLPRVAKMIDGALFTGGEDGCISAFFVDLKEPEERPPKERTKIRVSPY